MTIRCHYWGQGRLVINLGDALVPLLLNALGHDVVTAQSTTPAVNPGRQLLVIGSLLDDSDLDRLQGPIDVWGCGWRGKPVASRNRDRLTIHAVRGPLSAKGLGLPASTVIGDPGLLMPSIIAAPRTRHGKRLVLPHCLRIGTTSRAERLKSTGADAVLSPWVLGHPSRPNWPMLRQAIARTTAARRLPTDARTTIKQIAGAGFVLTGSLHGAILCHAYGTPWAAYDDQGIDTPGKWHDLAALLQIDIALVRTIRAGEDWWATYGQNAISPDLKKLVEAFPFQATPLLPPRR